MGELGGVRSPATVFSPIVGVELSVEPGPTQQALPLDASFEHGVVVLRGALRVDGGELLYIEPGRTSLAMEAQESGTTALLLGGEPFGETVLMWWNFVARTRDEIAEARDAWLRDGGFADASAAGDVATPTATPGPRFGRVVGDPTPPIAPPPLPWGPSHVTVP
jgi:redox-sensitive bicupin YhaK (pirin superfamily)